MSIEVSTRLKFLREKHGLSQRELAKRAGVTNSTISLIEQNRVSPSVSSLKKVLEGLPMTLAEFFTFDVAQPAPSPFFDKADMPDIGGEGISFFLVGHGLNNRNMTMLRETYAVGSDTGQDMLQHEGQECGVVIRGEIELTVGEQSRVLKAGDGYYFDSKEPHRFRNVGDAEAEVVSTNSQPNF